MPKQAEAGKMWAEVDNKQRERPRMQFLKPCIQK